MTMATITAITITVIEGETRSMSNVMTRTTLIAAASVGALMLTLAGPALAHPGHLAGGGFIDGLLHPLSGIDHLMAMTAVGVWAARQGGRALWALPAAFVVMLAGGAALGIAGVALPAVEALIAASVVVLGLLAVTNVRVPVAAGVALVGAFAVFHGHAHGAEMPEAAHPLLYGAGFLLATALPHAAGIALTRLARLAGGCRIGATA